MKTVRVPPEVAALFAKAEEVVSRYFRDRRDDPTHGTIEISGERYLLVRAASLSVEFFTLVEGLFGAGREPEADEFARNILFDLAHALGKSDAKTFHAKMGLVDPIARLSAGPVHFAHAGWAFVDISPESRPEPNERYFLLYDHPYSFESDAWIRAGRRREFPVCIMNAGYSSGWCEESFGLKLVASEVLCRAKGDDCCRFIMAPPETIQAHVERYIDERPAQADALRRYSIPDFFARKRAEEKIKTLYDRLRQLDQLRAEFFANVSHELRTPLALILGLSDRLGGRGDLSAAQQRDVEAVTRNAQLLLAQVNDLLAMAKLESGKRAEVEYSDGDLARLVRLTASHFEVVAGERAIAYAIEAPESLSAQVDYEQTQRILLNLLANAFKFTPRDGRVRCRLEAAGDQAVLEVADSGPGVPREHRESIFERFVTLDGGLTRRFGGTGLGLAIVKELVAAMGGRVSVGDAPEGGALFTVELPLKAPAGARVSRAAAAPDSIDARAHAAAVSTAAAAATRPAQAPAEIGAGPLVLVVEDNAEMSRFVAEALAASFRVACAFDGLEGLDLALALRPDAIVTDVMMPRMSGGELVRALRQHRQLDATPIVVLTAKAEDDLRVTLLRDGAQDYVMKPFSVEELRARVGNLVATKRTRDLLQRELASGSADLETLAGELVHEKRRAELACDSLAVAREKADRASHAKSDFLRLVSHELRTPLASIQMQADRLMLDTESPATARQRQMVQRVITARRRLTDLIDALLEYARMESGRMTVRVSQVDLAELAAEVVAELRPLAEQKKLALTLSLAPGLAPVASDARLVRLILVNLVANAIKYTHEGSVELAAAMDGGRCRLSVSDTGPGIPSEQRERVFEPFEQLERVSLKHSQGVGLGLALAKEMVGALGGQIELESTVGRGSTFVVFLSPEAHGGDPHRRG